MAERVIKEWDADPSGQMKIKVYQVNGFRAALRGVFQPSRTFDVPSGVCANLYEPYPLKLRANQRVEVVQGDQVVKL